jgi:hypothetical protein
MKMPVLLLTCGFAAPKAFTSDIKLYEFLVNQFKTQVVLGREICNFFDNMTEFALVDWHSAYDSANLHKKGQMIIELLALEISTLIVD